MPGASSENAQSMADNESKQLQMLHRSNEADEGEMMQLVKTEHVDVIESDSICQDIRPEGIVFESELDEVEEPVVAEEEDRNEEPSSGLAADEATDAVVAKGPAIATEDVADVAACNLT